MEYNEVDPSLQAPSTSGTSTLRSTGCGTDSRLVEIFEKEIDREVAERMGTISEIADNIKKCQQTLDRLRKVAVLDFYTESQEDLESEDQPSIHPAVKKLIGKRPRNVSQTEQFLASNHAEWKRETRKTLLKKRKSEHLPKAQKKKSLENDVTVKPRYIPPKIPGNPEENSTLRGNTKKMHMRVLVGNVAKEIQHYGETFDPATHKWMVYVRSAPGSLPIDREVARVHFFLHPSYKPHDIVTILKPPFTLNRRGWGEFPMRVQLHFKNPLNKPADIIHHLKLNGSRSGLHTRSAETFSDLWLYPHKKSQEPKLDKAHNSDDILSLASDMLKEVVPDFTSEVICSRCQTTSLGTDSHNCRCDIKDNTQENCNTLKDSPSASSSEENSSSDSEDSAAVESQTPKPLPCKELELSIDDFKDPKAILIEAIKKGDMINEDFIGDSVNKISSGFKSNEKENGNLGNNNNYGNEPPTCSSAREKDEDVPLNHVCFTSGSNNCQSATIRSDILNVEASDILDALGLNYELKEGEVSDILDALEFNYEFTDGLQDVYENVNEKLETNKSKSHDLTQSNLNLSSFPFEMECTSGSYEEPINKVNNEKIVDSSISTNSILEMLESKAQDSEPTNRPIPNHSENAFVDSNILMEEVPIDEFINNIVEEEVVLDGPDFSFEDALLESPEKITGKPETQQFALKSVAHSSAMHEPQNQVVFPNNQLNHVENKPIEPTLPLANVFGPSNLLNEAYSSAMNESQNQVVFPNNQLNLAENQPIESTLPHTNVFEPSDLLSLAYSSAMNESQNQVVFPNNQLNLVENQPIELTLPHTNVFDSSDLLSVAYSSAIDESQNQVVFLNNQLNHVENKPIESTLPHTNVFGPSNLFADPKNMTLKCVVVPTVNSNKSFKTTQKYVKIVPLQFKKPEVTQKGLVTNNQVQLAGKRLVKITLPNKQVPVKSQNNQIPPNTNHISKKQKVGEKNQAYISVGRNHLVSQRLPIIIPPKPNPLHISLRNETTTSKTISVGELNNMSRENCLRTSLLKPQFRNNNTRNPNSLLRPVLPKQNVSNLQEFITRPGSLSTYSVLKSLVRPSLQQTVQSQNILLNTAGESSTCFTKNVTVNQPLPQVHKSSTPVQVKRAMNTSSCSQSVIANKEVEPTHNQKLERSGDTDHMTSIIDIPELLQSMASPDAAASKCSAPESFSRERWTSKAKPFLHKNLKRNHISNFKIVSNSSEGQTSSNCIEAIRDTIKFEELIKALRLPKTSVPSRPITLYSDKIENEEFKVWDFHCVLSCNNLHSGLQKPYSAQAVLQFGRKSVMLSKDQLSSHMNDQIFYYLEHLRLLVNTCTFAETEYAVRWLVRGLPLVFSDASLEAYKMIHPYCADSRQTYCSWPSFKQAAAEWLRAKTVVRLITLLKTKRVLAEPVWSTRTVYWWCRTHGYSPAFCLIGPENPPQSDRDIIEKLQQKTPPTDVLEWMASVRIKVKSIQEEDVDVVGVVHSEESDHNKRKDVCSGGDGGDLICGKPWVRGIHSYVAKQAFKMGREPLVTRDPPQSVAATLLSHAAASLVEDLLRRGLSNAAYRGGGSLEPRDICKAISKRKEFDIFTGQGLYVDINIREHLKSLRPPKRS